VQRVYPAKLPFSGVDPRGLEPLTSAMRGRCQCVVGVSRRFKTPLYKPDSRISQFSLFTDVYPGNCQRNCQITTTLTPFYGHGR
jgi:hypothetical protein